MEAAVHAYVRALNEGNLEAIVALYAEGAEVEDPVGSPPKRGLEEIRAFYAASIRLQLEVALEGQVRAVGHEAAFAFSVTFEVQGRRVLSGCSGAGDVGSPKKSAHLHDAALPAC